MPRVVRSHEPHYQHQADAVLSQANPVSGTKYTVLDTVKNARIIGIAVQVTWTVQPTPLEIHLTIDGQSFVFSKADPASATWYVCTFNFTTAETAQLLTTTVAEARRQAFLVEGKSIKVEAETTGGTTSNLSARVRYAKKV